MNKNISLSLTDDESRVAYEALLHYRQALEEYGRREHHLREAEDFD